MLKSLKVVKRSKVHVSNHRNRITKGSQEILHTTVRCRILLDTFRYYYDCRIESSTTSKTNSIGNLYPVAHAGNCQKEAAQRPPDTFHLTSNLEPTLIASPG